MEIAGAYGSFLVSEKHENIIQDEVFGQARRSRDGAKWLYLAKVKEEKTKSYFEGGTGAAQPIYDVGERYTGTSRIGLFVLDTVKRSITKLPID